MKHGGMLIVVEFFVKDQLELDSPKLDSPLPSSSEVEEEPEESELDDDPLWLLVLQTRTELPLECSEKSVEYAFVQHCMPLPFPPTPSILKAKDRSYNVVAFCAGIPWDLVPKNVMGRCDIISATQGRSHKSGMTKEPCHRCATGAGEKNWPKRKKVPRPLNLT